MFLYENNGQFIDVYKLEPKLEEITRYKKSEMGKIPDGEKVWRASTNKMTYLESNLDVVYAKCLNECYNNIWGAQYHDFRTSSGDEANKYLTLYFTDINNHKFFRIKNSNNGCKYIVLLNEHYSGLPYPNKDFVMDGIISVSRSLYLLEAFLNRRFDLFKSDEMDDILKLFDIQHIGRINTDVLKNICEYQLLTDSYESIINRSFTNKDVVSKVKKLAR